MKPGSQTMREIPLRFSNDKSVNRATSAGPEDMSLKDKKLIDSPVPVYKGFKTSTKDKILKKSAQQIALEQREKNSLKKSDQVIKEKTVLLEKTVSELKSKESSLKKIKDELTEANTNLQKTK